MALVERKFHVILIGMVAAFLVAGVLATSASADGHNCEDYPSQKAAQAELRANPEDPNGLDGSDDDGIACENRPTPSDDDPVLAAIGTDDDDRNASSAQYDQYNNDDDDDQTQQQQQQQTVINVPNKPLPNTSGPALLLPAAGLLIGLGLTVLRVTRHRG